MKLSILFILTVIVSFMLSCKSNKTLTQSEQTDTTETVDQTIGTIMSENCDPLRVLVRFTINKEGLVENVKIKKSSGNPNLDAEAVRVVKSSPQWEEWEPPIQRRKPVKVRFDFPIVFDPCGSDYDSEPESESESE